MSELERLKESRISREQALTEEPPKFIIKRKNGRYVYSDHTPRAGSTYIYFVSDPKEVTIEELEKELQISGRRWYATDKISYALTKKHNCSVTDGEPWCCLPTLRGSTPSYWVGTRHEPPKVKLPVVVCSIAEMYLKSACHQARMFKYLTNSIHRITGNAEVFRTGSTFIEIRETMPTEEQLELLSLLPGLSKIYKVRDNFEGNGGNPCGNLLHDCVGGIPVLPECRALCLISGGIDSPVAAYKMMVRGTFVSGVHFLNSTNDTAAVIEKNRRIGKRLSEIQGHFRMHYVDISSLQQQIVAKIPNQNRTIMYKWFMLALASVLDDSSVIVVGDAVGQVASQTVHNISTLYSTTKKAIVAPLSGSNKQPIVDMAKKIGTYDVSIINAADCCQYMMCKVGTNLNLGVKMLRHYVSIIDVGTLPITTELYHQGQLKDSTTSNFTPSVGIRESLAPKSGVEDASATRSSIVYFDAAAGTPPHPAVIEAIASAPHGNPNSLHNSGRAARMAIERVRSELAAFVGVPATDIIFTSGGTESNNIALHSYTNIVREPWSHASTDVPHSGEGAKGIPVRVIDLVNHETGSICRELKRPSGGRLHVDACQALGKIDFKTLDLSEVDTMSFTAHKLNGPCGIGALYVRGRAVEPLMFGGHQEHGLRPGSENVAAIVGFGAALKLNRTGSQHREIDEYLCRELPSLGLIVNRRGETSGYIVHTTLPVGFNNVDIVAQMSALGVEIGTGSACKSNEENTTVYETLGIHPFPVKRSLRFSYDSFATLQDAEAVVSALRTVMKCDDK